MAKKKRAETSSRFQLVIKGERSSVGTGVGGEEQKLDDEFSDIYLTRI